MSLLETSREYMDEMITTWHTWQYYASETKYDLHKKYVYKNEILKQE